MKLFGLLDLQIMGYIASTIVLISLFMVSMIKFRWINLIGSLIYAFYGFLISVLPVVLFNVGIVIINIYFIYRHYTGKDCFELIESNLNDPFLKYFLKDNEADINLFAPNFTMNVFYDKCMLAIRNGRPIGVFISRNIERKGMFIELDYVIREFRDFKTGQFLHKKLACYIIDGTYDYIETSTCEKMHEKYLAKLGYLKKENNNIWQWDKVAVQKFMDGN